MLIAFTTDFWGKDQIPLSPGFPGLKKTELKGKQTRNILLNGLMKMYKDQGVEGYYDPILLGNYNTRYNLFILAVVFLGLIAIVVPFVIR